MIQIEFNEPRLDMSHAGRLIVRVITYAAYGLIGACALVFSFSDVGSLRSVGFIFILFLAARIFQAGRSDKSLSRLPKEGEVNAARYFSPAAYRLIERAYELSSLNGGSFFLRLFRLLILRDEIQTALLRTDIALKEFIAKVEEALENSKNKESESELKKEIAFLGAEAFNHALNNHDSAVLPKDLFAGIIKVKDKEIVRIMSHFSMEENDLEAALIFSQFKGAMGKLRLPKIFISSHHRVRHRVINRSWTSRPTPVLDNFSEDLTDLARLNAIGFMVGHEKEYEELVDVLSRPGNKDALLIGEPGSGKSVMVEHLAFMIVKDRVPAPLFDKRLVSLSLGGLSAGAKEGELAERIEKILSEINKAGNIILYIPEIHNLVKSGSAFALSAADVLIPAIKGTEIQVIGATYPREFKQHIDPATDFRDAFENLRIEEVSEDEAVKILIHQSVILEAEYGIVISFKAIKEAVILAHKYFRQKLLPGSAAELLKESLAHAKEKNQKTLSLADVVSAAEKRVNVPIHEVRENESEKLLNLETLIHKSLIDQDEAVSAVSRAMREYRSGLSQKGGPIASFLFVGPTGVGKTELSKILAEIQFGSEKAMIRFDMSEYQDKQSFFRLIGSPDGSVSGSLTDAVMEKPYSLVLLDEFEKAHPDILNLFLQVFDDGRLTDNLGRTVDFENTIIIATSNAHSEFIKQEIENGAPVKEIAEQLKRKLTDYFRTELLNRFSEIIVFKPLSKEDIYKVAWLRLAELAKTVFQNQGIVLNFSEEVAQKIAELGFDPVYGARPIKRVISDRIRGQLAEKLLRREIMRGAIIRVIFQEGEFSFINE